MADAYLPGHSTQLRPADGNELHLRWRRVFRARDHDGVLFELVSAYSAPDRHYHNVAHVGDCLRKADEARAFLTDFRAVAAALFFHDAVYDPTRSDNEERSADLAERHLRAMGLPDPFIATVRDLILDTRHVTSPTTGDGRYVVDIDLSILGAPPAEFDAYERAIRREYAHVPDDAFRAGRSRILHSILDRPRIYGTDFFRDLYEAPARANLTRSLSALSTPPVAGG
jgi:predicted metal-dependent HD superfamily phosphohydrolase